MRKAFELTYDDNMLGSSNVRKSIAVPFFGWCYHCGIYIKTYIEQLSHKCLLPFL